MFIVFTSAVERSDSWCSWHGENDRLDHPFVLGDKTFRMEVLNAGDDCTSFTLASTKSTEYGVEWHNVYSTKPFLPPMSTQITQVILSSIFHMYNLITDKHELFPVQCCIKSSV